jgi:hypothetical protein
VLKDPLGVLCNFEVIPSSILVSKQLGHSIEERLRYRLFVAELKVCPYLIKLTDMTATIIHIINIPYAVNQSTSPHAPFVYSI